MRGRGRGKRTKRAKVAGASCVMKETETLVEPTNGQTLAERTKVAGALSEVDGARPSCRRAGRAGMAGPGGGLKLAGG